MKNHILREIENLHDTKNKLVSEIKAYVQDPNTNLNDRWIVFVQAGKLGILPNSSYYFEPEGIKRDFSFYDDINIQENENYTPLAFFTNDNIIVNMVEFKESYLEKFVWNCIYDY